jgi:hypothetical protein
LRKDKDFIICNFTTMYQHVGLRSIQRITTTDRNKRTERKEKFNPITVWRNGSKSRQTVIILSITILFCRVHPVVLQNWETTINWYTPRRTHTRLRRAIPIHWRHSRLFS